MKPVGVLAFVTVAAAVVVGPGCNFTQDFQVEAVPDVATVPNEPAPLKPPALADTDAGTCDTASDPRHCGVCGHSCLGGACRAGACDAIVLASGLGDNGGVGGTSSDGGVGNGPGAVIADATDVYWVNGPSTVMRISVNGGKTEVVATLPEVKNGAQKLQLTSAALFVMADTALFSIDRQTKQITKFTGTRKVFDVTIAEPDVFFVANDTDGVRAIFRCPLTECPSDLAPYYRAKAPEVVGQVAVNASMVFTTINGGGRAAIWKLVRATGVAAGALEGNAAAYGNPIADATDVYSSSYRSVIRSPIQSIADASVMGDRYIASGNDLRVGALLMDDENVYWHEPWGPRRIVRCPKRGCVTPDALWASTLGAQPIDWWGKGGAPDGANALAQNQEAFFFTTGDGRVMKLAKPPKKTGFTPQ